ncbi:hypothetical protein QM480_12630 [Flectobacillus sp. DC10W]|uniref:RDD family protein n=1 Tax=Flectobacillus longus TaxID=2984207 RepID=A0ABT6YNP0_9BACT|nr:hypothetical protein [Flectobacillus longus]MDI9865176.1 hypothetical protein [Flectobacillus longus]
MELDDLKHIWQNAGEESQPSMDAEALLRLSKQRSQNIIERLVRNIWYELVVSIFVVIAWFYYTLFYAEEHWRIGGLTMGIFMIASLGFYLWGLFRLKSISMADISLKESLTLLIKQFKLYLKAYTWLNILLIPFANFLGAYLILSPLEDGIKTSVMVAVGMAPLMWWLMRWYINRLYGQHLTRLEGILQELNE